MGPVKLGGEGIEVEIDESFWWHTKYMRGSKKPMYGWVLVIVERGTGAFFAAFVPKRTRRDLEGMIFSVVRPGSVIYTDEWKAYHWLGKKTLPRDKLHPNREPIYIHYTVNHKKGLKNPITGAHTNTVEGLNSTMKRRYKLANGIRPEHVPPFLDMLLYERLVVPKGENQARLIFQSVMFDIEEFYSPYVPHEWKAVPPVTSTYVPQEFCEIEDDNDDEEDPTPQDDEEIPLHRTTKMTVTAT